MPRIEQPTSRVPGMLQGLHLFHFDGATCAQRVRFALGEKGLARGREEKFDSVTPSAVRGEEGRWVSRIVSLVRKDHLTQAYADIHPNMVVPALVHDGVLFLESMDIIEYLDEAFGGAPLVPREPGLRAATMKRVEQAKDLHRSIRYVTFHWGLGRLAMLSARERRRLQELARRGGDGERLVEFYDGYSTRTFPESDYRGHLARLYAAFRELDAELGDGRRFLTSDEVTIADAFWSMKVLNLLQCGYPVEEHHPAVFAWYQRIEKRPSFQNEVMGKNRLLNRAIRAKTSLAALFGNGVRQAVEELAS